MVRSPSARRCDKARWRLADRSVPHHIQRMVTAEGLVLIAELVAAVALVIALTGFTLRRTMPWLVGSAMAFTALIAAALFIVDAST
jgi:hypothetical protein